MWRQLKKTHCSSPKAHGLHPAILDQTPNQVHVLSPPLFFQVLLVSALPSDECPAATSICLSSRNSLSGFWHRSELQTSLFYLLNSPSYHSWHNTLGCQPSKGAAALLGSCWEYMSQPASCHAVALCMQALWGLACFQQYAALAVQAQGLLFPEWFYTWCLALVQNTKWRGVITAFWEEDLGLPKRGAKKSPTVVLLLGNKTEAQWWLLLGYLLPGIQWLACRDPLCAFKFFCLLSRLQLSPSGCFQDRCCLWPLDSPRPSVTPPPPYTTSLSCRAFRFKNLFSWGSWNELLFIFVAHTDA